MQLLSLLLKHTLISKNNLLPVLKIPSQNMKHPRLVLFLNLKLLPDSTWRLHLRDFLNLLPILLQESTRPKKFMLSSHLLLKSGLNTTGESIREEEEI